MKLYDYLKSQGLDLIPASDLKIKKVDQNHGYDFTVENNYTFATEDGVFVQDTMAVILPQTKEAQNELKEATFKFMFHAATGNFKFVPSWDATYGLYILTKEVSSIPAKNLDFSDADELLNLIIKRPNIIYQRVNRSIKGRRLTTSVGRLLINLVLPDFYSKVVDYSLTSDKIHALLTDIARTEFNKTGTVKITSKLYKTLIDIGRKITTLFPLRMEFSSAEYIRARFLKVIESLKEKNIFEGLRTIEEVMEKVKKLVKKYDPELYDAIESGARGSWSDIQQMLVVKGYVTDPLGRVIPNPILGNYYDGLNQDEFFTTGYSARKGIVDRAINTSGPGYLLRRLAISCSSVYLDNVHDCGTKNQLEIEVKDETTAKLLKYRYVNGKLIETDEDALKLVGKKVKIRSPIFCKAKGICKTCYGTLYKYHKSRQIGIIAAQAIGERVQQIMMKTFHTGGLAKIEKFPELFKDSPASAFIKQDGDKLYLVDNKSIRILLDDQELDYEIGQSLYLKDGIVRFYVTNETPPREYTLIVPEDEEIEIFYDDIMEIDGQLYAIVTKKSDPIGQIWLSTTDVSTQMKKIDRLFNASEKVNDYMYYLESLWNILKQYKIPMVHLELVLSQMMRWKDNPYIKYRHKQTGEYIIIGSKQIPFYESPLLALAFEDVHKALTSAVLSEGEFDTHSPFEALLEGNVDELKKHLKEAK